MTPFLETLRLIRVVNCLMAMIGVGVGAYMTWFRPVYYGPLMASVAAFLVCAAGNALNDIVDVKADRINRPRRVLVRGGLTVRYAAWLTVACNVAALLIALTVNTAVTIAVGIAIVLLLAYNLALMRVPLTGNVLVALLGAMTFITGGLAVDSVLTWRLPGPLIPAVLALLFHLVREVVKDIQDLDGDRQAGVRTFPQIVGKQTALLTALGLFFVLVILTCVPVVTGWFSDTYKIIAVYVVDLPTLALLILIWVKPSPAMLTIGNVALKIGMALGTVALIVA